MEAGFSGKFFFVFLKFFYFIDAIFDLVHDVETVFHLPELLSGSGNLF